MPIAESDIAFLEECKELFSEAENYFEQKEYEKVDRLAKKDYTKINRRINTNLNGSN